MVALLVVLLAVATVAIIVLVVALVRSAAGRRTVTRGFDRAPAQQRVVPEVRQPPSPRPVAPVQTVSAEIVEVQPLPRPEPLSAPPSLVGSSVEGPTRLAAEVELGFEDDPGRIGIRGGSAMQRAFAFYAEELLADLRGARER